MNEQNSLVLVSFREAISIMCQNTAKLSLHGVLCFIIKSMLRVSTEALGGETGDSWESFLPCPRMA